MVAAAGIEPTYAIPNLARAQRMTSSLFARFLARLTATPVPVQSAAVTWHSSDAGEKVTIFLAIDDKPTPFYIERIADPDRALTYRVFEIRKREIVFLASMARFRDAQRIAERRAGLLPR